MAYRFKRRAGSKPIKLKKARVVDVSTPELKRARIKAITNQLRRERKMKPIWPQVIRQLTEERERLRREVKKG